MLLLMSRVSRFKVLMNMLGEMFKEVSRLLESESLTRRGQGSSHPASRFRSWLWLNERLYRFWRPSIEKFNNVEDEDDVSKNMPFIEMSLIMGEWEVSLPIWHPNDGKMVYEVFPKNVNFVVFWTTLLTFISWSDRFYGHPLKFKCQVKLKF